MGEGPKSGGGARAERVVAVAAIVLVALAGAFAWYVGDYYHASEEALAIVADGDGDADGVVVQRLSDKALAFVPGKPVAGLVLYPGAKVQPESYAPLALKCAKRGVLFVIVEPLFNLSVFDPGCADGVEERFPDVGTWAIGGHSLGGVTAADYALHHDDFSLVVLLASYPLADLAAFDGSALSVVGSDDAVLNWGRYESARSLLPAEAQEAVVDGGIHSYFGDYGMQAGDGTPRVSREEQQEQTAEAIARALSAAS